MNYIFVTDIKTPLYFCLYYILSTSIQKEKKCLQNQSNKNE